MPAPTRVGTETIDNSSANRDPASFTHTTTATTDLLLVCVLIEGAEAVTGTPTFDSNNLTLIRDTGDTSDNADVRIYIYGLISPGAVTNGTVAVDFVSNVNPSAICCINYTDTDTASVAAATNFINEDVNTTASNSGVHASGGTSGNTLFVVGCGQGNDMQPASVDNSFVEIWDQETGTNAASDFGHIGAEKTSSVPSAVNISYGATDQNTSVLIELVSSSASQTITGTGIASAESFGTSVVTGPITLTAGIASAESFGTAQLNQQIAGTGIASAESFGAALLVLFLQPTGVTSGEAFGTALLVLYLSPTGIASGETFGSATLSQGAQILEPTAIASGEAFGTAQLNLETLPGGIASAESFGTATVSSPDHFQMSASDDIAVSGENTTAQLTAPSGKSTSDFTAGRIQDDENPADAVDIGANNYTEMEWSIEATTDSLEVQYDFRVTRNGTVLHTYSVTPQLTVTVPAAQTIDPTGIESSESFGVATLPLTTEPRVTAGAPGKKKPELPEPVSPLEYRRGWKEHVRSVEQEMLAKRAGVEEARKYNVPKHERAVPKRRPKGIQPPTREKTPKPEPVNRLEAERPDPQTLEILPGEKQIKRPKRRVIRRTDERLDAAAKKAANVRAENRFRAHLKATEGIVKSQNIKEEKRQREAEKDIGYNPTQIKRDRANRAKYYKQRTQALVNLEKAKRESAKLQAVEDARNEQRLKALKKARAAKKRKAKKKKGKKK